MRTRLSRPTATAAAVGLIVAATCAATPVAASTGSGGLVEVTYSGYNDADATYRLSEMPAASLDPVTDVDMPTITVDPTITHQTWEGFGGSLEDATVYNLNRLSTQNRDAALVDLFDPVVGNGFSLMRLPIGCADFCRDAPDYWTYDDNGGVADPTLAGFSVQKDIDNGLIAMLQDITAINPEVRFYSSMWSPPAWMKTNGSIIGPEEWGACAQTDAPRVHHGASTGSSVDYYPVLAQYYVRYIEAYRDLGISIAAVTLQNEPDISMPYPSTCFTPEQLADFAVELGSAFDAAGIQTEIWGLDANEADTFAYADALLADPAVAGYVDGLGWHNYGGTAVWQPTAVTGAYPDTTAHVTEISNGAARLIEYFRNQVASYSYWVTMYEFSPGPGPSFWSDQTRDPETDPDYYTPSLVSFVDGDTSDYQLNGWYYSFGQFSRYIQAGAQRIDSSGTVGGTVTNVAFRNPDGTIVVIAANRGQSTYNSDLTGADPVSLRIVTPAGEVRDTLPGDTVATYVITPTVGQEEAIASATASVERSGNAAFQALDGDSATVWTSGTDQAAGQDVVFDLGEVRTVDQLTLAQGALAGDYPEAYELTASVDGATWSAVLASGTGTRDMTNIAFDAISARYLRVALTAAAGRWWSIAEAAAYDSGSGLIDASPASATAFATGGTDTADRALDGSATTRWTSGTAQQPGQDFTLDLGAVRTVAGIELDNGAWSGDHPRGWEVQTSLDGSTWSGVIASGVGTPGTTSMAFGAVDARFVRVTQTGTAAANYWSIAEARIYSDDWNPIDRAGWSADASAGSAAAALDGDQSTRWSTGAAQAVGQYFTLDLDQVRETRGIQLDAGTSAGDYPRGYRVDVSPDGQVWHEVAAGAGHAAVTRAAWQSTNARFVRVTLTDSSAAWWSIHEVTVDGAAPSGATLEALDRSAWSVTTSPTGSGAAAAMVDGLLETRWSSGAAQAGSEWIQIDLGSEQSFSALQLNAAGPPDWADQLARSYRGDFARGYEVYVSSGGAWTLVASGTGDSSADVIGFPTQTARYVNVHQTGSTSYWWSIAEAYVYE